MIPQIVRDAILDRSGGICEEKNCKGPDFRGYQNCHIEHRKMGGRHGTAALIIDDARNIFYGCAHIHDVIDRRCKEDYPGQRQEVLEYLKEKIKHDEWRREFAQ